MNIKKYHFNNKYLQKDDNLYNSQTISKNLQNNIRYYNKNFYQTSMPNQSLNFYQNIFLPSEQSTLLTSEDFQNKNVNVVEQLKRRNNCHCLCHHIEETKKHSCNNIHIINCHHSHCFHHISNNTYYRPIHNSVEIGRNRNLRKTKNFELLYNYEKLKNQYNIIWPGCNQSRNERLFKNNYSTVTKDKNQNKFFYSNNINILENNPNLRHFNRSCDDLNINDNDDYKHNFLLRKTRSILGFTPYDLGFFTSKNRFFHYKPKTVNYRTYDNKISSTKNNKDKKNVNNPNDKKNEIPNFANFTFKEKNGFNDNIQDNMRYNQLINNQNNPINQKNDEIQNSNEKENNNKNENNLIKDKYNSENVPKMNDYNKENKIYSNFYNPNYFF